jgi:hypothetical protein
MQGLESKERRALMLLLSSPRPPTLGAFSREQTEVTEIFYENLSYLLLNMLQSPTLDPHGGLQRPRMKS